MENLTAIEKLDALLEYLTTQPKAVVKSQITEHFSAEFELIEQVLDRLIDDGFVKEKTNISDMGFGKPWTTFTYILTFDGRFFYENGGYKEQRHKEQLAELSDAQKERIALRNENLVMRGTWAAAVVGLLVLAWQVYSYFYPVAGGCNILNLR
jgi:hypothetical protein